MLHNKWRLDRIFNQDIYTYAEIWILKRENDQDSTKNVFVTNIDSKNKNDQNST